MFCQASPSWHLEVMFMHTLIKCNSSKGISPTSPSLMVNEAKRTHKHKLLNSQHVHVWVERGVNFKLTATSEPKKHSVPYRSISSTFGKYCVQMNARLDHTCIYSSFTWVSRDVWYKQTREVRTLLPWTNFGFGMLLLIVTLSRSVSVFKIDSFFVSYIWLYIGWNFATTKVDAKNVAGSAPEWNNQPSSACAQWCIRLSHKPSFGRKFGLTNKRVHKKLGKLHFHDCCEVNF